MRKNKFLLGILSVFLLVGGAFAENVPAKTAKAENPADFDYLFVKINGRAIVEDGALLYLTGDSAKAIFYRMQAKAVKDSSCRAGMTKQFHGLLCTQFFLRGKENFECYIGLDLTTGKSSPVDELCEQSFDDKEVLKEWDARGNKKPKGED
ncbi:MAG: hypothetical protein LBN33_09625 [Desulfovibrio sp.]|jgi:hypothetical protein|nr:hypothetical protein [Desulfovibrio sp.]